jgi:tetratricopeptide (TPR) repeat protein
VACSPPLRPWHRQRWRGDFNRRIKRVHAMFRSVLVNKRPGRGSRRGVAVRIAVGCALALGVAGWWAPARGQVAGDPSVRRVMTAYHAGRLEEAAQLVDSVPSSLPAGDAAVLSFYRGLLQFAAGDESGARAAFARAIELDPRLVPDPALHSPSRLRAFEEARDRVVSQWRSAADRAEAAGDLLVAQRHWQNVLLAQPEDSVALGRLAGVHMALAGVERGADAQTVAVRDSAVSGVADPGAGQAAAGDPVAGDADDDEAATTDGAAARVLYDPGRAALLGVVPGLGELYTGRPVRGVLIMGAAAGAVAYGMLTEKVDVRCLSVPADGVCPPEDVAGEEVRRPHLTPSLGVAAAITVLGALDAYFAARRANARAASPAGDGEAERGAHLERPALVPTSGTLRLELLRFRF